MQIRFKWTTSVALILGLQWAAAADDTAPNSVASASEVASGIGSTRSSLLHNKKFDDSSGITDPRLRAQEGSLDRYSGKVNLIYLGPEIGALSNPYQPNPDGSVTHNPTMLRGDVALRLRLGPSIAVNFGTGIADVTPFADGSRTDINNPFIGADYTHRKGNWQFRESIQGDIITVPEIRNTGESAELMTFVAAFRNLGQTRWLVGVDSAFRFGFYNRPYSAGVPTTTGPLPPPPAAAISGGISKAFGNMGDGNASQADLMVAPNLKYQFSDQFGVFTGIQFAYYNPRRAQGQPWVWENTPSERFGVEWLYSRAFFISPFVAFYPSRPALDSTTINLVAVFSVL